MKYAHCLLYHTRGTREIDEQGTFILFSFLNINNFSITDFLNGRYDRYRDCTLDEIKNNKFKSVIVIN